MRKGSFWIFSECILVPPKNVVYYYPQTSDIQKVTLDLEWEGLCEAESGTYKEQNKEFTASPWKKVLGAQA